MVYKLQKFGPVKPHYEFIPDHKSGHSANPSFLQFHPGSIVSINIPFYEINIMLGKKLFRHRTIRSGLGRKNGYILHRSNVNLLLTLYSIGFKY